jgi:hypothetical protein
VYDESCTGVQTEPARVAPSPGPTHRTTVSPKGERVGNSPVSLDDSLERTVKFLKQLLDWTSVPMLPGLKSKPEPEFLGKSKRTQNDDHWIEFSFPAKRMKRSNCQ